MPRFISASLFVDAFTATGNPGEYQIESGIFVNQADATGAGALDVAAGFVIYIPASDPNTFTAVPGLVHRYKFTEVNALDPSTLSGTIVWDEPGEEVDAVTNGVTCLVSQTAGALRLGIIAHEAVYADVAAGTSFAAFTADERNILANLTTGGGSGTGGPAGTLAREELLVVGPTGLGGLELLNTPLDPLEVVVWINGIRYWPNRDFTLTGKVFDWSNSFVPDPYDHILAEYRY
jgi:hypothetical protein